MLQDLYTLLEAHQPYFTVCDLLAHVQERFAVSSNESSSSSDDGDADTLADELSALSVGEQQQPPRTVEEGFALARRRHESAHKLLQVVPNNSSQRLPQVGYGGEPFV